MARVKFNPLVEMMQGAVGDLVFKRYGDKLVVSKKPVFQNRKFSKAQKKNQEKFREAVAYARRTFADQEARKSYEKAAKETGKPILSLMIADFLHTPGQTSSIGKDHRTG